jgi:uncharacterized repeat protein (TIGR01451 family)
MLDSLLNLTYTMGHKALSLPSAMRALSVLLVATVYIISPVLVLANAMPESFPTDSPEAIESTPSPTPTETPTPTVEVKIPTPTQAAPIQAADFEAQVKAGTPTYTFEGQQKDGTWTTGNICNNSQGNTGCYQENDEIQVRLTITNMLAGVPTTVQVQHDYCKDATNDGACNDPADILGYLSFQKPQLGGLQFPEQTDVNTSNATLTYTGMDTSCALGNKVDCKLYDVTFTPNADGSVTIYWTVLLSDEAADWTPGNNDSSLHMDLNGHGNNTIPNQVEPDGEPVIVYKMVLDENGDAVASDTTGFTVELDGADPQTISVGNPHTYTDVAVDSHTLSEINVPAGYTLLGISEGTCSAAAAGSLTPGTLDFDVVADQTTTICVYNEIASVEPTTADLTVNKIIIDENGDAVIGDTTQFSIDFNDGVSTDALTVTAPINYNDLTPAGYSIEEINVPAGYTYLGVRVCNTQTDLAGPLYQFTLAAGDDLQLCVYNQISGEQGFGSVRVEKTVLDAQGNEIPFDTTSFTVQLDGANTRNDLTVANNVTYSNVTEGAHSVTEINVPSGYTLVGYSDCEASDYDDVSAFDFSVSADEESCVRVYNQISGSDIVSPLLTIKKANNAAGPLFPGNDVVYTITVANNTGVTVSNVVVTDVTPEGINYKSGSWSSSPNVVATEPTYGSPGDWNIGDMAAGDTVTLTYTATIVASAAEGTYNDLALAQGDYQSLGVIATGIDSPYVSGAFVGTPVEVVAPFTAQAQVSLAQVLVELPRTGADSTIILVALFTSALGGALIFVDPKKLLKKINKGGLALVGVVAAGVMLASPISAATYIDVRMFEPDQFVTTNTVDLGYSVLDVKDRTISIQCLVQGPSDVSFNIFATDTIAPGKSGDNRFCNLTTGVDGLYKVEVKAMAGAEVVTSNVQQFTVDKTAPSKPLNYTKNLTSCVATLNYTTANDGQTSQVEIYRSTQTTFTANSSTLLATVVVGPNQSKTYIDNQPNCNLTYYYAIRSVDNAGNTSGFTADKQVITVVVAQPASNTGNTNNTTGNTNTGNVAGTNTTTGNGTNQNPAEGGTNVLGENATGNTPTPSGTEGNPTSAPQVAGETETGTSQNSNTLVYVLTALVGLTALGLVAYALLRRNAKKSY